MRVGVVTDMSFSDDTKVLPLISQGLDTLGFKYGAILSVMGDRLVDKFTFGRGYDNVIFKPSFILDKRTPRTERNIFLTYIHMLDNCDKVLFILNKEIPSDFFEGIKEAAKKRSIPVMVFSL